MALWVAKTVANVNLITANKIGAVNTRKSVVEYEVPKHTDLQMGTVCWWDARDTAHIRPYVLQHLCNNPCIRRPLGGGRAQRVLPKSNSVVFLRILIHEGPVCVKVLGYSCVDLLETRLIRGWSNDETAVRVLIAWREQRVWCGRESFWSKAKTNSEKLWIKAALYTL